MNGSTTLNFTYNDAGLRTSKTGHTYTYNGSLLASDDANGYTLYFRYDQNGSPIGFGYKPDDSSTITEYYYRKNLQGDITGILNTSGTLVASYTYDAWGNHLKVLARNSAGNLVDATEEDIAQRNPLRYRGYVYDTESSLYYLQSRYYAPAIGRFISADSYAMTYETPVGANMFAYCLNNPVMGADFNGEVAIGAIVVKVGLSIGATYIGGVVENYQNGVRGADLFTSSPKTKGDYIGAALSSLIPGAGVGSAITSIAVELTVKHAVDSNFDIDAVSGTKVFEDLRDSSANYLINVGIEKCLNDIRPNGYSSFRNSICKIAPNMSQDATRSLMQGINRGITKFNGIKSFLLDVLI